MNRRIVESYLRSACSVLLFDIGELWSTQEDGHLTFHHVYTIPEFKDDHNLIIRPTNEENRQEANHQFSPIICRCVREGSQIVWANTMVKEGLTGRREFPLNSAVGIPLCASGQEVFIMVLYAVKNIPVNPSSLEILISLGKLAITGCGCFEPIMSNATPAPLNSESAVGVWNLHELIRSYSSAVAFHLLPLGKMNAFFDYQEYNTIKNVLLGPNLITAATTASPVNTTQRFESGPTASDSAIKTIGSSSDTATEHEDSSDEASSSSSSSSKSSEEKRVGFKRIRSHSLDLGSLETEETDNEGNSNLKALRDDSDDGSIDSESELQAVNFLTVNSARRVDAFTSYKMNQNYLHEFMISLLGISSYNLCELWFVTSNPETHIKALSIAVVLHRNRKYLQWTNSCRNMTLKLNQDIVGDVVRTSTPAIDEAYGRHDDDAESYPRGKLATELGIQKALGIPLVGEKGLCGVLVLYSDQSVSPDMYCIDVVQNAVNVLLSNVWQVNRSPNIFDYVSETGRSTRTRRDPVPVNAPAKEDSNTIITRNRSSVNPLTMKMTLMGSLRRNKSGENLNSSVGTKLCKMETCGNVVTGRSPYCPEHGDTRRCQYPSCTKCAQGATKFCIRHGGGRRCTFAGCNKGARDKSFCAAHGGGKRCRHTECTKSAVGGSGLCTAHGGGKRCKKEGCS